MRRIQPPQQKKADTKGKSMCNAKNSKRVFSTLCSDTNYTAELLTLTVIQNGERPLR
jgi:hypothetical protein